MAKKPSVDGFIPRNSPGRLGEFHRPILEQPKKIRGSLDRVDSEDKVTSRSVLAQSDQGLTRADVDESLREIDSSPPHHDIEHRRRRLWRPRPRKVIKWFIILLLLGGVAAGGWLGVKAILAGGSVFKGDIFGLVQQKELKMDSNGRSNVLILGTSEDDPGHQASYLTDSIMVVSIDQKNKNAYMVSVPRDLEVKYGRACLAGYSGKINGYFNCVNEDWTSDSAEDERQRESRKFIGDILGLDVQYSVHVNYTVMRDLVKALDGITVTIESRDPRGQMDANFDWKCKDGNAYASRATILKNCPPNGHFIDYPNGPVNLDAEHALYLAQARGDVENYGFEQSNFDREKNQQKIIVAIREKAMSTGTLTNVGKVTGIVDALGSNLRTNFDTSEIRTLINLGKDIPATSIQSISLIDNQLANTSGQPTAGLYNFSQIQAFIKKKLNSSPLAQESAHVVVLNASGVAGAAQLEADRLSELGMEVDSVGNAPSGDYSTNMIYQIGATKPKSAEKLASLYGASVQSTAPPVTVPNTTHFVIIIAKTSGDTNQ